MSLRMVIGGIWNNPGNRGQRLSRLFRGTLWQLDKRLLGKSREVRLANGARLIAHPDCVISSSVIYAEWPEYHELQFIRRRLCPAEYVVDVGANIGHVLLLLSDIVGAQRLIGFEPTPVTFGRLRENWLLNGWLPTSLYQAAVGARTGRMFISDSAKPVTTNSIHAERHDGDVEVPVETLDSLANLWSDSPIGLLKIDVEGFETDVFRGASGMLKTKRPRLIMFESLEGRLDPLIAMFLNDADYSPFQLNSRGEPEFSKFTAQNLFAVPRELEGTVRASISDG